MGVKSGEFLLVGMGVNGKDRAFLKRWLLTSGSWLHTCQGAAAWTGAFPLGSEIQLIFWERQCIQHSSHFV